MYSITISTDGAAFEDYYADRETATAVELARILRRLADGLDRGGITPPEPVRLYDVNGNSVGFAHQVEHAPQVDAAALDAIAAQLTGREWNASDIEDVAALVEQTGRTIAEPPSEEPIEGPPARSASTVAEMENGWTA